MAPELGVLLGPERTLQRSFAALMDGRVAGLLARLGVQRAEGRRFYDEVLRPCLCGARPAVEELLRCSAAARHFEVDLAEGCWAPWWVEEGGCGSQVVAEEGDEVQVVWSKQHRVHLTALPEVLARGYGRPWLRVSGRYEGDWHGFFSALGLSVASLEELTMLVAQVTDVERAEALVRWLAPHGRLAETPQVLQLLSSQPWLPGAGRVLRLEEGWLQAASSLEAERCFAPVARPALASAGGRLRW